MNTDIAYDIFAGVSRYGNSGGPMSRTRNEHIKSSLLGAGDGIIRCGFRIRLGLMFQDTHPVDCLEAMLEAEGFSHPEELRERYALPQQKLICGPVAATANRLMVFGSAHDDVLGQALMLGLCTAQMFDPERPVLWTEASLMRAVDLFDPRGFYA